MTGAFVCFIDSYLLFSLFGLSNSLRIRGYFIKYSRIFHHVSMDISSRIRGYASFLLCPRDLLVVCFWVFSYWWLVFCYPHISFSFTHAKQSSPPEGKGNSLLRRLWETKVSVVASNAHFALPLYKQRDSFFNYFHRYYSFS